MLALHFMQDVAYRWIGPGPGPLLYKVSPVSYSRSQESGSIPGLDNHTLVGSWNNQRHKECSSTVSTQVSTAV